MKDLTYKGLAVRDDGEMLCLTDMWRACGSPPNKEPWNWERFEGAPFIEAVMVAQNLSEAQVKRKKRGKSGASWMHWQPGMAYAKYLDHGFHIWANTVLRAVMEGRASGGGLADGAWIDIGAIADRVAVRLESRIDELATGRLNADPRVAALDALSTREILDWQKVPSKGRRPLIRRATHSLKNAALAEGVAVRRCPRTLTLLWPRNFAARWMDGAGKTMIRQHLDKRAGQGQLRLLDGGAAS